MDLFGLKSQIAQIRQAVDERIANVINNNAFIRGPEVSELERALEQYTGANHCVSCGNGTDALQLALMAIDTQGGDIVFTTSFSFFSTAEVIPLTGATPYFVDVNKDTYNICIASLRAAIEDCKARNLGHPKAIIAADMFGLPADYCSLRQLADEEKLVLIEDAAQSFGGSINGIKTGNLAHVSTTSFFPTKPLGCFGDGGAVFTNDDGINEKLRSLAVHGKGKNKYDNVRIGVNSRLDTLQAAVLLEKLPLLDDEIATRNRHYAIIKQALSNNFDFQVIPDSHNSAMALLSLRAKQQSRNAVLSGLEQQGIPYQIYYPTPLYASPAMQQYPKMDGGMSQRLCNSVFSVPVHASLSEADIEKICQALTRLAQT